MIKKYLPNNGTNTNIHIIASLDGGDNANDNFRGRGSKSHERSTSNILLQFQLHTHNFQTGYQELVTDLIFIVAFHPYSSKENEAEEEKEDFDDNSPPILVNNIKTKTFKTGFTPLQ